MRTLLLLLSSCLLLFGQARAQDKIIHGKVTDDKGLPIPNVSVVVKGVGHGTSTGADGTFTLSVPATARTLVISSIGFGKTEMSIGSKTEFTFSLTSTADKDLQDVVVVGYGTTKKSDLTSSIVKVGGDKVANIPFTSIDQS